MRQISFGTPEEHFNANRECYAPTEGARVLPTREMIAKSVGSREGITIVDIGPGDGSNVEPYRRGHTVLTFGIPIESVEPQPCDVLIMTEVLEHLIDPVSIAAKWMPLAKAAVISHPLDETDAGGGPHRWSFSEDDFRGWFYRSGHHLLESMVIRDPKYPAYRENTILGFSKREE